MSKNGNDGLWGGLTWTPGLAGERSEPEHWDTPQAEESTPFQDMGSAEESFGVRNSLPRPTIEWLEK
ncbi:hypothetical protein PAAG_12405 [Paracoccidioides lutzii Pb01]|uniref:Uncharacterized protein n=1 Tax=Paracoccidioides lutzii (strain ATCC MYA-826 / Pb01) TaxID=502779 RepID=A0A0A2VJ44_PARBA|nr:hypothetical protein PAAG_12405 [Paracoccidioides lutzii Pb01]KGQ00934.1 hypothetical protein PAAG_12405 [Paracoccidioides lutzii Pb01]